MKISIVGAGTWGAALAIALCDNHDVCVWAHESDDIELLQVQRKHPNLDVELPQKINFTHDLSAAMNDAEIVIIATPSNFVRQTTKNLRTYVRNNQIIVCVAKGIEADTMLFMSEIIEDVLGNTNSCVALSGPTHAEEVAHKLPSAIVSASKDLKSAKTIQDLFAGTCIRPYTNNDIKGVELCAALKNIIALACGISCGLGNGDNTKAAIMTRGISEITKLGLKMGCAKATFAGLAGIGDLIVTCTSMHSRNNRAGILIGQGLSPEEAVGQVGMVVEGVNALPAAMQLSQKYEVELPIIEAVNDIINNNVPAKEVITRLLNRDFKSELS